MNTWTFNWTPESPDTEVITTSQKTSTTLVTKRQSLPVITTRKISTIQNPTDNSTKCAKRRIYCVFAFLIILLVLGLALGLGLGLNK